MKAILALAAIFLVQTAQADSFFVALAEADAWIYQQTADRWALPSEIQLAFNVCMNNQETNVPLRRLKFVVSKADTLERINDELYDSNTSGCFRWYEKFPLTPFPVKVRPVKLRRLIRAIGSYSGYSVVTEFSIVPDPAKLSMESLTTSLELPGTISEADYLVERFKTPSAKVFAKKISIQLLNVNWKSYQVELLIDMEPVIKTIEASGLPSYRPIRTAAFSTSPTLVMTSKGQFSDWSKPTAEGASSTARVEDGHLLTTVTIRLGPEGIPDVANYGMALSLIPTEYEGIIPPVSYSEVICDMGSGLSALGFGAPVHECQLIPACLEGTDQCSLKKFLEKN